MSVHGINISSIAAIKRMAWGAVARWLELAAAFAERFNLRMLKDFVIHELQADEIRTFVGAKKRVIWVLTALEVWSRLWVTVIVGRRNFCNIKAVILNTLENGRIEARFLFTTDGFERYKWAAKRFLVGVCIYGQVIKKRRENRVVHVDRRLLLGTDAEREEALLFSEDSNSLNTSFIERHNLTIRQGCAYLSRRTT
jgi:IS1 family transposase